MREVILSEFLTLDGVMQAPGGPDEDREGGFEHGGWQMPYLDEERGKEITEGIAAAGGFLLGRKTYEIFAGYWPNAPEDEPIAGMINEIEKFVASRTLEEVSWQNSRLLEGDAVEAVRKLKQQDGGNLMVIGSGDFAQTLMQHDLVDEYRLMIHPIVLGGGKRLFRDGRSPASLELADSTATPTGVIVTTYRRAPAKEAAD